jgi:hypothetical protein
MTIKKTKETRREPMRFGNLLMINVPIDKTRRASYQIDLDKDEFGVIGLIVVHWAFLEYALFVRTVELAKRACIAVPVDALNFSFTRRLRVFRDLVNQVVTRKATKDKFLTLISRIARAEGYRHRIAHGLWSYNPKRLEQLWSINRGRRVEPFDVNKLAEFGYSLGELSFELLHPGGWRMSMFVRKTKSGSWVGGGIPRSTLLEWRQKQRSEKA